MILISERRMKNISVPEIAALIVALTALFAPIVKGIIERQQATAATDNTRASTFSIVTSAQIAELARMEKRIEQLSVRIDALEEENLIWQREYRVVWEGAKNNARQIVELGRIPVFDPPVQTFRGTLSYPGNKQSDSGQTSQTTKEDKE